jgi:hypothetical protein
LTIAVSILSGILFQIRRGLGRNSLLRNQLILSDMLTAYTWIQPNSITDLTTNARLSRQNGRERNEDCDVIDRTRCQGDHKRNLSDVSLHGLPSDREGN